MERSMERYDAVIVGARVAGAATAFALAQRGWRVALVERKRRPLGGTLSLPITQPRGLARFRDLGLLPVIERIQPRLKQARSYYLGLSGDLVIQGMATPYAGFDYGVILRREVLDDALLDFVLAAYPDAITCYDGMNVEGLVTDAGQVIGARVQGAPSTGQGSRAHTLYAPLIVGADGRFSSVARFVDARPYAIRHSYTTLYFALYQGVDLSGLADILFLPANERRLVVCSEVGEGLCTLSAWFPVDQFAQFRRAPESELRATVESASMLAGRLDHARLQGKVQGLMPQTADGYFRPTGGPGWALVGDARHFKDPASGQGLHDALYSVQQLVGAIDALTHGEPFTPTVSAREWPRQAETLRRQSDRELRPMYAFTYQFARGLAQPPNLLERALLRAIADDPFVTRQFFGIITGATDVSQFNRAAPLYMLRGMLRARAQ